MIKRQRVDARGGPGMATCQLELLHVGVTAMRLDMNWGDPRTHGGSPPPSHAAAHGGSPPRLGCAACVLAKKWLMCTRSPCVRGAGCQSSRQCGRRLTVRPSSRSSSSVLSAVSCPPWTPLSPVCTLMLIGHLFSSSSSSPQSSAGIARDAIILVSC